MKKQLFSALIIVSVLFAFSGCVSIERTPDELLSRDFAYTFSFEELSSEDIYKLSRYWIAETYNSAESVISFEDADLKKIKGSAIGKVSISGDLYRREYSYSIGIDVKDSRARIVFSNIRPHSYYSGGSTVAGVDIRYRAHYDAVRDDLIRIAQLYESFMSKGMDSDW